MYYSNFAEHSSRLKQAENGLNSNSVYNYRRFGFSKMLKNKDIEKRKERKTSVNANQNLVLLSKIAKTSAVMLYSSLRIKQGRIFELVSNALLIIISVLISIIYFIYMEIICKSHLNLNKYSSAMHLKSLIISFEILFC
jgi:hypothetical protein